MVSRPLWQGFSFPSDGSRDVGAPAVRGMDCPDRPSYSAQTLSAVSFVSAAKPVSWGSNTLSRCSAT